MGLLHPSLSVAVGSQTPERFASFLCDAPLHATETWIVERLLKTIDLDNPVTRALRQGSGLSKPGTQCPTSMANA
jgi:hypothetical protein